MIIFVLPTDVMYDVSYVLFPAIIVKQGKNCTVQYQDRGQHQEANQPHVNVGMIQDKIQ